MLPVGADFFPKPPGGFDDVYNAKTENAVETFQRFTDIQPTGQFGQKTLDAMWAYADAYSKWVYRLWSAPVEAPADPTMVSPVSVGPIPSFLHPTAGLLGNWALDWIVPPGVAVHSPEAGVIQKLSGHDPSDDTWDSQGVYGWSVYVRTAQGYVYYITHLGWRAALSVGQRVGAGTVVGKVGNQKFRPDHTHAGVTSPLGESDAKKRIQAVAAAPRV
jgi:murein DD-endopeptidase MepM/ murein hydrolase activator NlpD